ncbi:uncharacterized protein LOC118436949 [Folsomia candida]|uniref:Uncharacterized protein n=1 Tax=Folsomia candida TaxID=158441 RepID=A0A226DVL5_FOLCA|nr:uncharacterized protein LOC118436949 [Folsomia candida]OXA49078.1 hypothetical protein Fcan01_16386 [Folsomia candida]
MSEISLNYPIFAALVNGILILFLSLNFLKLWKKTKRQDHEQKLRKKSIITTSISPCQPPFNKTSPKNEDVASLTPWQPEINHENISPPKNQPDEMATFKNVSNVLISTLNPALISSKDKDVLYSLYKQIHFGNFPFKNLLQLKSYHRGTLYWILLRGMSASHSISKYIELYEKLKRSEAHQLTLHNYRAARTTEMIIPSDKKCVPVLHPGHIMIPINQIPYELLLNYNSTVKTKYMLAGRGKPTYDMKAIQPPKLISDSDFIKKFTETQYYKMVTYLDQDNPDFDPYRKLYGLSKDKSDTKYFIADLTGIRVLALKLEDNAVLCPCVVLFKTGSSNTKLSLVSIAIENLYETISCDGVDPFKIMPPFPQILDSLKLLYPGDGVAWEVAKLHATLNSSYISSLGLHPLLHFVLSGPISLTFDSILTQNSTKKYSNLLISQIIGAHSTSQTGVDANALNFKESVLWAENSLYYAFGVGTKNNGAYNMTKLICDGLEGHPIYGKFNKISFLNEQRDNRFQDIFTHQKFMNGFLKPVKTFVRGVINLILGDEKEIEFCNLFLSELQNKLPLKSIVRGEVGEYFGNKNGNIYHLANLMEGLLTYFIFNAVEHSIEHFLLGSHWLNDDQILIRIPVDFGNKSNNWHDIYDEVSKLNEISDRSRFYLASKMFFHPHVSKTFVDLLSKEGGYLGGGGNHNYGNVSKLLGILEQELLDGMMHVLNGEDNLAGIRLTDVAISVQS